MSFNIIVASEVGDANTDNENRFKEARTSKSSMGDFGDYFAEKIRKLRETVQAESKQEAGGPGIFRWCVWFSSPLADRDTQWSLCVGGRIHPAEQQRDQRDHVAFSCASLAAVTLILAAGRSMADASSTTLTRQSLPM
eukprot:768429-Hanusia_phi.AAC.7